MQCRRWSKRLFLWAPLGTVAVAWLLSLFSMQWAPRTQRHLFHLVAGNLIIKWQLLSMPSVLPPNAPLDKIQHYQGLSPCTRVSYDFANQSGVATRCSAVMYKPGFKVDGFQGLRVLRWTLYAKFSATTDTYSLIIPLFIPLLIFTLIPLIPIVRSTRQRRKNCCDKCGYNLTGNQSGVCPECGRPITTPIAPVEKAEYQSAIGLLQRLRDQAHHVNISEQLLTGE